MKKRNNLYFWASDIRTNSGEGLLANQFLSDIKIYYKNFNLININKYNGNYQTFYSKYFLNFFGAAKLWYYYWSGYKIMYINYLPIWNFLIFLILPPTTILGPITGSLLYNRQSLLNYFRRGILLNILKNVSLFIIFLRYKKILFSTELLKSSIKINILKNCYFSYVLQTFVGFAHKHYKKNIDFLIYHRLHNNKNNKIIEFFIRSTMDKNFRIVVIGDPLNYEHIHNMGYVSRNKIKSLLSRTKYTFGSSENLYTLFVLDAISKDVIIFYDKKLKIFNTHIKYHKLRAVDFDNNQKFLKFVMNNTNHLQKSSTINYQKKISYAGYFNEGASK